MRKQETLERLRRHADAMRALGARSVYLFGSTARDDARPGSDVDLFVDYDDPFSAIELMRLRDYVRGIRDAEADVTTRDGLHPLIWLAPYSSVRTSHSSGNRTTSRAFWR